MSFRGPTNPLMAAMASMMGSSMPPQPYHQMQGMQPMAGLIPMQMMPPMPPGSVAMGVTVPSGVTTISAPPVRNIQVDVSQQNIMNAGLQQPSLLGVYPGANAVRPPFTIFQQMAAATQDNNQQYRKPRPAPGSTITVFVGNITDRASDMLIRQLLSKCGSVNNWKRVQGANGKLQAFGFCEYCDQESAMRAVRLLKDFEIADKKLVVKVDPKTQEKLDEYLKSKGISGTELDDQTKEEDSIIAQQLQTVLREHEIELSKEPDPKERQRRYNNDKRDPTKPENLSEMDLEDDKRSLIHREIDKFRDTYKKIEEKKEEEKKRKEELKPKEDETLKRERRSSPHERPPPVRERSPDRDRNRNSRRDRDRDRERERERDQQRDRDRGDRDRYRERDRERRSETKDVTPVEDEEEAYERRRLERQMKEKEASYQRRLREWEQREGRKSKDYEKERQKEERRRAEEEDEKRKLKEFLEDYDDERFDQKYYKGNSLMRRLRDREKEKIADESERLNEKKELDELREKLELEGHPDPDSEVRKRMMSATEERDRNNKVVSDRIRALMLEARQKSGSVRLDDDLSVESDVTPKEETPVKTFGFQGMKLQNNLINSTNNSNLNVNNGNEKVLSSQTSNTNTPDSMDTTSALPLVNPVPEIKRKKLSVSDVFNANEDDDISKAKKRKLPTLIDDNTDSNLSTPSAKTNNSISVGADNKTLTSEEKRKQIKALIEKIPTSKEELFKYEIDWSLVDNSLMERRIRPWINKKIAEYIGEEELALLDFICNKLQSKSSAQSILDDVAMVLDEEAEVFVVKMWRLLIYEIEAKKLGLGK